MINKNDVGAAHQLGQDPNVPTHKKLVLAVVPYGTSGKLNGAERVGPAAGTGRT